MQTLDGLIEQLQERRKAIGKDIPVRLVIDQPGEPGLDDALFVSRGPIRVQRGSLDGFSFLQLYAELGQKVGL